MKKNLIYLITLFFVFSCTSKENTRKIHQAEKLLDTHPDSSLLILKSIESPKSLSNKYVQKYLVLSVLAKYKTYQDVRNDTDIFKAAAYFNKKSNNVYKALASYAAASVKSENGNYADAMGYYKNAERTLLNSDNFLLKALVSENIAYIYDKQYVFGEAIKNYKLALDAYKNLKEDKLRTLKLYMWVGSDYLYLRERDSALTYYDKAYKIASDLKDSVSQATLLNNKGLLFNELGNNKKALSHFKEALKLYSNQNSDDYYKCILNLAYTYLLMNKVDSSEFYVDKVKKSMELFPNDNYKAAVTNFLKEYYKQKADYASSVKYFEINKRINSNFIDTMQNNSILKAEKDSEYAYAENLRLKAERRFYFIAIGSILGLFALVVTLLFYNKQIMREKEYNLRLVNEKKNLKERELELLKETKKEQWSNNLYQYIAGEQEEIMHTLYKLTLHSLIKEDDKLINLLETTIKDYKKHLQVASEQLLDTKVFFEITGLTEEEASKLLNSEKLLLSLLYCHLTNQQIALMLGSSANSIRVRSIKLKAKMENLGIKITDDLLSKM